MHFGLFIEEARPGQTQALAFRDVLELADAAETFGLDGVWLGEIHFNPGRSVISAQMVMATAIASRTRRVRVGTAVQVLPLSHPLRIAEEAATVDQLSEGRFDMGIGRSGAARTYDVLGIPYGESQARFRESLAIIREAWKGKPFSHKGDFYQFENAVVTPRPFQDPHPPLRMAANSPETFPQVAKAGLALFVGLRDLDIPELQAQLGSYRDAWRESGQPGHASVYLRLPVYAGETERSIDNTTESGDMVVLRYLADGTLDSSFGDGGVVRTSFGPNTDTAYGIVLQPNGKIAVAGITFAGTAPHFALARYEANGSPDVTFAIPTEEPSRAGLTKTGNPRRLTTALRTLCSFFFHSCFSTTS